MKSTLKISCIILLSFMYMVPIQAQRGMIKRKIKNEVREDMKEQHAEPQREKGGEAIKDITYENDERYPIPENPVKATLVMETKCFKNNGKLKETMTVKMVFGNTGECMIMNEGDKNEARMLFDYEGAATYMINEKGKTATKMPMINFQKMAKKKAESGVDFEDDNGEWKRTDEQQDIYGFNCRKYIYTNKKEKTKMYAWVSQDINIDLNGNHLFGGQIKDFSKMASSNKIKNVDENFPRGMMVRNVYFEKNSDTPSMQMDITTF